MKLRYAFARRGFLRFLAGAGTVASTQSILRASPPIAAEFWRTPFLDAAPVHPGPKLVPAEPSSGTSYWCTWGIQNYSLDHLDPMNHIMIANNLTERQVFEDPGWATNYFQKARSDLYILFDLGWEVPRGLQFDHERWRLGTLEAATDKFPSCTGSPAERLRKLNQLCRRAGWRGAGIWVPAQAVGDGRDGHLMDPQSLETYFRERARWTREAGIEYWKVDYGARSADANFRQMLTRIAHEETPAFRVEHARGCGPVNDEIVPWEKLVTHHTGSYRRWDDGRILNQALDLLSFSDVLRTYDVTAYFSVPTTLDRVAQLLAGASKNRTATGVLNCEDEPYIAACLGCATGVLRHPLWKDLKGMAYDPFQVRKRIDEVTRAVRWQRLAPAWSVNQSDTELDSNILKDSWVFHAGETWAGWLDDREVVQVAPARVARGIALPEVSARGEAPFVAASRHPNGSRAVTTLPRIQTGKGIHFPLADVTLDAGSGERPVGVFGHYRSLTLRLSSPLGARRLWAQDLTGDAAVDITSQVKIHSNAITLTGELIDRVGLSAATPGDLSSPGVILLLTSPREPLQFH
jgi:hypothetical protein